MPWPSSHRRQARLFPPMADEKMRYQALDHICTWFRREASTPSPPVLVLTTHRCRARSLAVQGLLGTSSTRRHFFRLRWIADLNALVLSYTEEFPTETSAWRTVEWSERVRIHASSEELSCLTIVLKSSGALVHLRADAPADFVSWLANLQAALPSKPLLPIPHQSLKAFELHSPGMGRIQSTLTPRQVHGSVRRWHYARTAQCAKILAFGRAALTVTPISGPFERRPLRLHLCSAMRGMPPKPAPLPTGPVVCFSYLSSSG